MLILCASIVFYALVNSRELRQHIFPLTYRNGAFHAVFQDLVISSADTMHLMHMDVNGPSFSLNIPDLQIKYSIYPPRLHGFTAYDPDINIILKKGAAKRKFPSRTVKKILGMLGVQHGTLNLSWNSGILKISDIMLMPASAAGHKAGNSTGFLTGGTCNFYARFGEQIISGSAHLGMKQDTDRIQIESSDIKAVLKGHPVLDLAAKVETGITPEQIGTFTGTVEIKDTLAILPPAMHSTPYMKTRLKTATPVPAQATIMLGFKKGAILNGKVNIPPWFFPEKLRPAGPLPADWRLDIDPTFLSGHFKADIPAISSSLAGTFSVAEDRSVKWDISADAKIKNFSFYIDDNHAAEGLKGHIALELKGRARPGNSSQQPVWWHALVSWNHGDLLIYPWYFDLSSTMGNLDAAGTAAKNIIGIKKAKLDSFLKLSVRDIVLHTDRFAKSLKAKPIETIKRLTAGHGRIMLDGPVSKIFNLLIKEPFQAGHPVFREMKPDGNVSIDLSRNGTEIRLNGSLDWHGNRVVSGLTLDALIPRAKGKCNRAILSWDRILIPMPARKLVHKQQTNQEPQGHSGKKWINGKILSDSFYLDKGSLPLSACAEDIVFGPVTIPAGKGTITINQGEVTYSTGEARLTGVKFSDIMLEQMVNGLPLKAAMNAKNLTVTFTKGIIRIKGTITTRIAGGTVEKSGIWMDISGPVPRFGADIKFHNIDLSTLTSITDFGKITGRIEGHIKKLVISGKQPESFELELRSVKTSGVDQEISIKAIRSLSILGGGGGGIPLLGEFFKNFSYSRIAVSCSLKNDIFTMHGLIKKDHTEYLVERGFWGGVNVINQNPGGRIAFSDMLERLARISKSGKAEVE